MGHITSKDAYKNLEDRINWFTQGAPPTENLYKILQVLYTEPEARWVALLPVRPFTDVSAALAALPAGGDVLIAGSLYLAGEVLRLNAEFPD